MTTNFACLSAEGNKAHAKSGTSFVAPHRKQLVQSSTSASVDNPLLQVDLQYPRRNRTAPASPQPKASPQKAGALPAGPEAGAEPRPSFSDILVASLEAESETRAWFSDELKYQYVRQTRTPLNWPQVRLRAFDGCLLAVGDSTDDCQSAYMNKYVSIYRNLASEQSVRVVARPVMAVLLQVLALGTGLQDRSSLSWWQPALSTQPTMGPPDKQPWAPWTLSLEIEDGKMSARQADTPEELQLADDSSAQRYSSFDARVQPNNVPVQ